MTEMSTPAASRVMAQVWRRTCGVTVLVVQRRAGWRGGGGVSVDEVADGVAAERAAAAAGEERLVAGVPRRSASQTRSTPRCGW